MKSITAHFSALSHENGGPLYNQNSISIALYFPPIPQLTPQIALIGFMAKVQENIANSPTILTPPPPDDITMFDDSSCPTLPSGYYEDESVAVIQ